MSLKITNNISQQGSMSELIEAECLYTSTSKLYAIICSDNG